MRTSCAAETINSVLRPYLDRCRECTDLISRQLFLNLFILWFNMHKFERGPRKGKSPYELAGIDLGTDDWIGSRCWVIRQTCVDLAKTLISALLGISAAKSPSYPLRRDCFVAIPPLFITQFVKVL